MLLIIIVLILIFFIFVNWGSKEKIIISFKPCKEAVATFILENYYEVNEFRQILEKVLITVFGRWSLNFTYPAKGSGSYCEGILSSIFTNKPQFQIINNEKNEDFLLGLSRNIDAEQYLGFECIKPLQMYVKKNCITGLLNFKCFNDEALIYLIKIMGHFYENDSYIAVQYFNEYYVYSYQRPQFDFYGMKIIDKLGDYSVLNGENSIVLNIIIEPSFVAIMNKIPNMNKFSVKSSFHELVPLWGQIKKNNIVYKFKTNKDQIKLALLEDCKNASIIKIKKHRENITYDFLTHTEYEKNGYNTKNLILLEKLMLGKNITLKVNAVNPVSDHNLKKINVERVAVFDNLLKKFQYDEKVGEEKANSYQQAIYNMNGDFTHEKNYSITVWK